MMSKQLVVAIAGVTCGGKTTIANNLANMFNNISVLHQDDFYHSIDHLEIIPEFNYHAWDLISAYNMDKMITIVNSQSSKDIIVLDGILLLEDVRVMKLANLKFFVIMDKESCRERRIRRDYLPPEPDGYFDKYAWPEYERHLAIVQKRKEKDIIFLNGNDSVDCNMSIVVNHINQYLMDLK